MTSLIVDSAVILAERTVHGFYLMALQSMINTDIPRTALMSAWYLKYHARMRAQPLLKHPKGSRTGLSMPFFFLKKQFLS